ncbi:hypothetical protein VTI74DRAFT_10272 [Chaetomium olivicolor]
MEPPTKRPRFGPSPFQPDDDDPEADELNERPEDVNARRDPARKLERSRAFAASKLKFAWERIIEKYGKDLSSVSDEIDLRTGEIVVDNGHIQSLKVARLGGESGDDDVEEGDGLSEAGSLNEEDKMLRGEEEGYRLSTLGLGSQLALPPSIPPQLPPFPFSGGGWPGTPAVLTGASGFTGMMYPGQGQFGAFSMQYGMQLPVPATDPTWSVPELPSPFMRNTLAVGESTASTRKKTARLSLSAAREHDGDAEDDILLDMSGQDKEKPKVVAIKQKVLLARPPPEQVPDMKKRRKSAGEPLPKATKPEKSLKPAKPLPAEKKKPAKNAPKAGPKGTSPRKTPAKPKSGPMADTSDIETVPEPDSRKTAEQVIPSTSCPASITEENTGDQPPREREPAAVNPPQSVECEADGVPDPEDPDVYINISTEKRKLTRKPRNQTLRVELPARRPPDDRSFLVLSPEPREARSPKSQKRATNDSCAIQIMKEAATAFGVQDTDQLARTPNAIPEWRDKAQTIPVETFSRNMIDPAYAFSDDDEPISSSRPQKQKSEPKPKPKRLTESKNPEGGVLREICLNVGSGSNQDQEPVRDAPHEKAGDSAPAGALSPTLAVMDNPDNDVLELPAAMTPRSGSRVLKTPEQPSITKTSISDGTTQRQRTRRRSVVEVHILPSLQPRPESPAAVEQSESPAEAAEALPQKMRGERRSSSIQIKHTPTRAPSKADQSGRRSSLDRPQEIPETSPDAQRAASPVLSTGLPATGAEARIPDLRFSSPGELAQPPFNHSNQQDTPARAPSPTLTDPASKPSTALPPPPSSPPKSSKPVPAPQTPVKTPSRRRFTKTHQSTTNPATTTTTTAATTTIKRTGLLSLLPRDPAATSAHDSEEDELSIISPIRPPGSGPGSIRSTPAARHVRVGLLATSGGSGRKAGSVSASASKLKRAVLATSASSAASKQCKGGSVGPGVGTEGGEIQTPSGRKTGRRRKSMLGGLPVTPSSRRVRDEAELVQTPGGTMRRCGEGGFRCERDFCFSCL